VGFVGTWVLVQTAGKPTLSRIGSGGAWFHQPIGTRRGSPAVCTLTQIPANPTLSRTGPAFRPPSTPRKTDADVSSLDQSPRPDFFER
ncbi:hypothetical protein C2E31_08195, partial [Rhodopirellula baltica]